MSKRKIFVVLDLDSTLINTLPGPKKREETIIPGSPRRQPATDKRNRGYHDDEMDYFDLDEFEMRVHKRPGLERFLTKVYKHCASVSIWSAGHPLYVNAVAGYLEKTYKVHFDLVWTRDDCKRVGKDEWVKPIEKFVDAMKSKGATMKNTVLVDDLKENLELNPDNALRIYPYHKNNPYDYGLYQALEWIIDLACPEKKSKEDV